MRQLSSKSPKWASGCLKGARQVLIAKLKAIRAELILCYNSLRQPAVSEVWEEGTVSLQMGLWMVSSPQVALGSSQDAPAWGSSRLGSAIQREILKICWSCSHSWDWWCLPALAKTFLWAGWAAPCGAQRGWFGQHLAVFFVWSCMLVPPSWAGFCSSWWICTIKYSICWCCKVRLPIAGEGFGQEFRHCPHMGFAVSALQVLCRSP